MDLRAHAARLEPHLAVVLPEGTGPFPVCVQLHGCGGVQPMQFRYAEAARQAGVAVVVLDSLAPRDIGRRAAQVTVCTGLRLRGAERAIDLLAALAWLEDQPWADRNRLAAAGWSHGAWAIMEALTGLPAQAAGCALLARLSAAILFYPYAGALSRTHSHGWGANRPKVYACLAGRDAVVGRAGPRRALDRLQADGLAPQILALDDATHCFDDEHASDPRSHYRTDLAERAEAFYVSALRSGLV